MSAGDARGVNSLELVGVKDGLKMLRRLPLGDVDELEPCLGVEALV